MIMSTTFLPVSGKVHSGMNLASPALELCSITTMIFLTPATRSMAPPMPLIILPGIIQLARSPFSDTSMPPSTARSIWPPRIITKESVWWKIEAPGTSEISAFDALMRSGSPLPASGVGPTPSTPFSEW